jgi:hypothetical protein
MLERAGGYDQTIDTSPMWDAKDGANAGTSTSDHQRHCGGCRDDWQPHCGAESAGSSAYRSGLAHSAARQSDRAIGVGGVTAQQDGQIAKAGVDALAKTLGR